MHSTRIVSIPLALNVYFVMELESVLPPKHIHRPLRKNGLMPSNDSLSYACGPHCIQ